MIPKEISEEHVLKAIDQIDWEGVPENRLSTKFYINFNGRNYPQKYVISLANIYVNGKELDPNLFSGGEESNKFLSKLGFKIVKVSEESDLRDTRQQIIEEEQKYLVAHSWALPNENVAIKQMDKSCFLHKGSVIPLEIRNFFGVVNLKQGQKIDIYLKYESRLYEAFITNLQNRQLTRLFWKSNFADIIRRKFPDLYLIYKEKRIQYEEKKTPKLVFQRSEELNVYIVNFETIDFINTKDLDLGSKNINLESVELDLESIRVERYGIGQGKEDIQVYGDKHELDPMLRKKTIEFHGLNCLVCGFNFEAVYGERGKDFIEIHHIKPIPVEIGERLRVNYETDFVPICANCHRMIHRRYDEVVSIGELKEMLKSHFKQ